ncbi:MAG: hypothetical protein WBM13_02810 [Bacteroidia bacterium]
MTELEKKRFNENPKVTETITFRTTLEKKMRLIRDAMERGMPLGTHCEDVISNSEVSAENAVSETNSSQLKKLTEVLEELLEKNSELQEQLKTLTEQPKPITEVETKSEKEQTNNESISSTTVNISESLITAIVNASPEKDRTKFEIRLNKLCDYRIKHGKAKTKEEAIYQCIMYCIQFGTFFDAG